MKVTRIPPEDPRIVREREGLPQPGTIQKKGKLALNQHRHRYTGAWGDLGPHGQQE